MKQYRIVVTVIADTLRSAKGIDVGEENEYEQCIESLIEEEMGWVEQSGIHIVSVEEEPVEAPIAGVWEFVEKYYPNYYSSGDILLADDLQKIIDGEAETGSSAEEYFINTCDENMEVVLEQYIRVHKHIYEKAIEGYLKSLKA